MKCDYTEKTFNLINILENSSTVLENSRTFPGKTLISSNSRANTGIFHRNFLGVYNTFLIVGFVLKVNFTLCHFSAFCYTEKKNYIFL